MKHYKHVAVGGTFDRFHKGHESLLTKAFSEGEKVSIGITSDDMVRGKSYGWIITSYAVRKRAVSAFLTRHQLMSRATIVKLTDPYGTLTTDTTIEVVVVGPRVSEEVLCDLPKRIEVVTCETVCAEDGSYLSSTRIRQGDVDREGKLFVLPKETIYLPSSMRQKLQVPLGAVLGNDAKLPKVFPKHLLVTIGDESTYRMLQAGIVPHLAVVDLHVQRKRKYQTIQNIGYSHALCTDGHVGIESSINPAGQLTPDLFTKIKQAYARMQSGQKTVIVVEGEDDLAALASIHGAPLETIVWYGQPPVVGLKKQEGIVKVRVTEHVKAYVRRILSSFPRLTLITIFVLEWNRYILENNYRL